MHFIMQEISVPEGYRSEGDMHLIKHTFEDGVVTLVSDPESPTGSKWSTGSYATARQLTVANANDIYLRNADGTRSDTKVVSNNQLVNGGSLFAVVLKWTHPTKRFAEATEAEVLDHHNWRPVYGDTQNGYHLADVADGSEAACNAAICTAIKANPYLFKIGSSGQYEVLVENMPGDILHYLHTRTSHGNRDNVQYTIFYGWTDAVYEHYDEDGKPILPAGADEALFTNIKQPPKTGDHFELARWSAMLVLSGMGAVLLKRRKHS